MQNDAMSKIKDSVFYRYQVSNDRKSMLAIKSLIPSTWNEQIYIERSSAYIHKYNNKLKEDSYTPFHTLPLVSSKSYMDNLKILNAACMLDQEGMAGICMELPLAMYIYLRIPLLH
jgi:hypothetical protein